MGVVDGKTFKSGDSVAVRLPKAVGIGPDVPVRIEYQGTTITIRPVKDPAEEKRKLDELIAALRAIGRPEDGVQRRDPFEAPRAAGAMACRGPGRDRVL